MLKITARHLTLSLVLAGGFVGGMAYASTPAPVNAVHAFRALCDAAMDTMMRGMDAPATGDVDHDFVAMMVPHHQGAIDMAIAELRYGKDENLKRIAQEIIVDQQQEIAAMRLALHQPLPPSAPAPTSPTPTSKESP